ncbi:hypothetical protein [Pedobacter gandavensis]|uniref:hypothetical protein n=1 Tax=Pedobacter gandavensis TaxID=2679963 RepID=UPI00292DC20E|nr:hypothetical protein [Pedobacter gandavensis]
MKHIKINTPLQAVAGFSTAEAVIIITGYQLNLNKYFGSSAMPNSTNKSLTIQYSTYKSYTDYNATEQPMQLKSSLPYYNEQVAESKNSYTIDELYTLLNTKLTASDYDVELNDGEAV